MGISGNHVIEMHAPERASIERFRKLTASFYTITGIPSSLLSKDGYFLTYAGDARLSPESQDNRETGSEIRTQKIKELKELSKKGEKSIVYTHESGLLEAITQVKINDHKLYYVLLGQFLHQKPSPEKEEELISSICHGTKNDVALPDIPVIPEDRVGTVLEYLVSQAELALEEQFEKYRQMFMLAPDEMCIIDFDGYLVECNQTFFKQTGFSPEEIEGKHLSELPIFNPEKIDIYLTIMEGLVNQTGSLKNEFEWRRKDGSDAISEMHVTPIKTKNGEKAFQVIAREITERKEWEQRLAHSEATLQSIFKAAPIGIGMVSDRRISWANEKLCQMTGFQEQELLGQNSRVLYPDEDEYLKVGEVKYSLIKEEGIGTVETKWLRKDGKIIDILLSSVPRDTSSMTQNVIFTALDITERLEKDRALKESETKYRNIIESIPVGMHMYRLSPDGTLIFSGHNQAADKILGIDNDQFIGKTIIEAFPDFLEKDLPGIYRWVAQTGTSYNINQVDYEGDTIKGAFEVHAFQTSPNNMVAAFSDITQRMREEQERKLLALAVEHADECIIIADMHGNVQYVNPTFERITGFSPQEIIGRPLKAIRSEFHDEAYYEIIMDILKNGEVWSGHLMNSKKDGTPYKAKLTISPIKDKAGKTTHFVTLLRDVTIEQKIEEQMRQTQKLEAIGTLAAGIAHEFNNILSSIIGYTELSELSLNKPEKLQNNFDRILKAGERARKLVQQILWFSRKTEFQPRPLKLNNLVKEVSRFMKASLPASIEFHYHFDDEESIIFADPNQIHHVLMNICTNAAQAMKSHGGDLDIRLQNLEPEMPDTSDYPGNVPGPMVKLSIKDTGPGIDEEIVKRIFEPFFSTKGDSGYSGLGLSVAHGIVKNHGGEITVENEPGQGATFHIFLPRIEKLDEESINKLETLPRGIETILCIDSEEEIKKILKNILENLGYRVLTASTPEEAMQVIQEPAQQIDLMITSQSMPKISGTKLAARVKTIRPKIPIILCTGYNNIELNEEIKESGIAMLLSKPISFSKIASAVRQVLDEALDKEKRNG